MKALLCLPLAILCSTASLNAVTLGEAIAESQKPQQEATKNALYNSIIRGNDSQLLLLLGEGLPLNEGNPSHNNFTPLMLAVDRENEAAIKLLLEAGADPKVTTKDAQGNDQTALSIAAGKSNLKVRALLGNDKAAIMLEVLKDTKLVSIDEAVEMLVECEIIDEFAPGKVEMDWRGNTTYDTTHSDLSKKIKYNYKLFKKGYKKFSDFGFILDIYRCYDCNTEKYLPLDAIKSLIAAGASLSWHANNKYALDYAAYYGHTDVVKLMLAAGANAGHGSPLVDAVQKNHTDIVKLLLAAPGIDVNAGNSMPVATPLSVAVENQNEEIVKLLLAAPGIKVNDNLLNTAIEKGNIGIVKSLLAYPGIDVNAKSSNGDFPLYYAAMKGNADIVKLLLEKPEINVNLSGDGEYGTALLRAIRSSGIKSSLEVIQLLLSHPGIDVNQSTASCYDAPLALAAKQGDIEIVKLLLAAPGIDVNKDSPIMNAASGNHKEIAEILLDNPNTYLDAQMLRNLGYGHEIVMMYSGNDTIRMIGERYITRKSPPKKETASTAATSKQKKAAPSSEKEEESQITKPEQDSSEKKEISAKQKEINAYMKLANAYSKKIQQLAETLDSIFSRSDARRLEGNLFSLTNELITLREQCKNFRFEHVKDFNAEVVANESSTFSSIGSATQRACSRLQLLEQTTWLSRRTMKNLRTALNN